MWKEDNGCTNCICMGGEVECIPEVCEVTSCPTGQKLAKSDFTDCCAVCVEDESRCEDNNGKFYNVSA